LSQFRGGTLVPATSRLLRQMGLGWGSFGLRFTIAFASVRSTLRDVGPDIGREVVSEAPAQGVRATTYPSDLTSGHKTIVLQV
jgi:hypothetical protein